jgi:cation diffusion facilitator CzcD-associated flavoprotein CzcO
MSSAVRHGQRVCVIGAGPCGLATLKNLRSAGLSDVVCYEESTSIGGSWAFNEDPARMSVYESTHIISSKSLSQFEDYPMPAGYPDFPSHQQIRTYFENYATHFQLLPYIHLRSRVAKANLGSDGRWTIELEGPDGTSKELFDYLVVCSGHHREPNIPAYPGLFSGSTSHSGEFKRADPFRGKRVLVVGAGNSACDIAVEVARVAERSCISLRRGTYIVPKIIFGRPVDVLYARLRKFRWLPRSVLQNLLQILLRLNIGPWEKYGLPAPQGRIFEMHPTLNSNILAALRDGAVLPRGAIARLEDKVVHFQDGTAEPFDAIIWATGFHISFPFFDKSVIDWDTARPPPLYLKMMHPRTANLFFIGLFQPIGCIWRLADHQARIAALQIAGHLRRPADIGERINREIGARHWHFDNSMRHAVEVDYHDFRRELMQELARAA